MKDSQDSRSGGVVSTSLAPRADDSKYCLQNASECESDLDLAAHSEEISNRKGREDLAKCAKDECAARRFGIRRMEMSCEGFTDSAS